MAVRRRSAAPSKDFTIDGVLDRLPARFNTLSMSRVWEWLPDLSEWLDADLADLPAGWPAPSTPDVLRERGINLHYVLAEWMRDDGTDPTASTSNESEHPRRAR